MTPTPSGGIASPHSDTTLPTASTHGLDAVRMLRLQLAREEVLKQEPFMSISTIQRKQLGS